MLVLIHVLIAFSGIAFTGYSYISPSKSRLQLSYVLVLSTIVSGTILVVRTHSPMLQACMAGLSYIGVCLFGIILARHKLDKIVSLADKTDRE